jgi:SAM-dependent methyltransferase
MSDVSGARTFGGVAGEAYDRFMGRYSAELARPFADFAGVGTDMFVLDVGCGPGAFTSAVLERVGAGRVCAIDPTPGFVEACRARHRGVDVRRASAERIPFEDGRFDCAAAQLVFHFVHDPLAAVAEMTRVVRPGGVVAACVWDFAEGMRMLRSFWDAASIVDPHAPDEARTMRFGAEGELAQLLAGGGLTEVRETTLQVTSLYSGFDELWQGFAAGAGPVGSYYVALPAQVQAEIRNTLYDLLGQPAGEFSLAAVARAARGIRPQLAG